MKTMHKNNKLPLAAHSHERYRNIYGENESWLNRMHCEIEAILISDA